MGKIFFITPDMPVHSGGVEQIYECVMTLNKRNDKSAFIVHFDQQFKKIG